MKKLVTALAAAALLAGCGTHDATVTTRDTSPAEKVNMPEDYNTIATKCVHGFRVFETNDKGSITAVRDKNCPQ